MLFSPILSQEAGGGGGGAAYEPDDYYTVEVEPCEIDYEKMFEQAFFEHIDYIKQCRDEKLVMSTVFFIVGMTAGMAYKTYQFNKVKKDA